MTPETALGYFLIYGPITLWAPVGVILAHYVDTRWDVSRAYDFKKKWMVRVVFPGLLVYFVLFFIGLLLTNGGTAH